MQFQGMQVWQMNILRNFPFVSWFEDTPKSWGSAVNSLLRCSVLPIVDVEAEGAGDGEGQVGDDGHRVHPGGPRDVLLIFMWLHEVYSKLYVLRKNAYKAVISESINIENESLKKRLMKLRNFFHKKDNDWKIKEIEERLFNI